MAQTIKLKRSATQGAVPSTSSLALGELAINTYDGKIFIKKDDGTEAIVTIGELSDNSVTAAKIATGAVGASELASTGVTAGSYGSSSAIPVVTVDSDGRVTSLTTASISGLSANSVTATEIATGAVGASEIAANSVGISELNVTDGSSGQVLKTDGAGNLSFGDGGGATSQSFDVNTATGDGSTTDFTLSTTPSSEAMIIAFIDGVFQNQDSYTFSGTTLSFDTAPGNGTTVTVYVVGSIYSGNSVVLDTFSGDGSTTAFTLSQNPQNENNTQIYIDGVYQQKSQYSVSGTTLTFSSAPPSGTSNIEVIAFTSTNFSVLNANSVTSASIAANAVSASELASGALNGQTFTGDSEITGEFTASEFIGDLRGAVLFKAQAGEALSKGDVVYISGISGNTTVVSKADADDANKMPAFGVAAAAASINTSVDVYTQGTLSSIDTSSFTVGDELFVSTTAGALTATAPTGETSKLQKIAKVTRSDASAGSIFITGAGRTNAVPNLDDGDIFIGNGSNQAVTASLDTKIESYLDGGTSTPTLASLNVTTTTTDDSVTITTTEDSSAAAPVVTLKRNSASPADADYLGQIKFKGENDADQEVVYAKITGKIDDNTDTTEDGIIEFANIKDGTQTITVRLKSNEMQLLNSTGLNVAGTTVLSGLTYPTSDGTNGQYLQTNGSGTLSFSTISGYTDSDVETYLNTSEIYTDATNNYLGVGSGASTPSHVFHVQKSVASGTLVKLQNASNTASDVLLLNTAGTGSGTNILDVQAAGSSKFLVRGDGNVGIGTSSPSFPLHISSTGTVLGLNSTSGAVYQRFNENGIARFFLSTLNGSNGIAFVNGDGVSERMRIDSSGNVGIGTNNPQTYLHVYGTNAETLRLEGNDEYTYLRWRGTVSATGTNLGYIGFAGDTGTAADLNLTNQQSGGDISIRTNGGSGTAERMRIDSSGWVSINNTSRSSGGFEHLAVDGWITSFDGTTTALFGGSGTTGYVGTFSSHDFVIRSGNTDRTTITSGGNFVHSGNNGTFSFGASSSGVSRIAGNADGLNMYYSSEANPRLSIGRDAYQSGQAGIVFNEPGYGKANGGVGIGSATRGQLAFSTSDYTTFTERMRIKNDGTVMINRTSSFGAANATTLMLTGSGNSSCAYWTCPNTANYDIHVFFNGGLGVIGSIKQNSSLNGVSYNTTSDYRLKENVTYDWDATTRLKQLKPCRFNWISDETNTLEDGFLAHEVATSVPNAVSGVKDAMIPATYYDESDQEVIDGDAQIGDIKEEAKIDPQQVDNSKLVPLLVKAIQELNTKLEAAEARITELEG